MKTEAEKIVFNRSLSPVRHELIKREKNIRTKDSVFWGFINYVLFFIIFCHISSKCIMIFSYVDYFEYALGVIFILNALYHTFTYVKYSIFSRESVPVESPQPERNNSNDSPNYVYQNIVTNLFPKGAADKSHSIANATMNTSFNNTPPSWSFNNSNPQQSNVTPKYKSSPISSPTLDRINVKDEKTLNMYLKEYEAADVSNAFNISSEERGNLLSFFWNHAGKKLHKDASPLLNRTQYQVSPMSSVNNSKTDERGSPLNKNTTGLDTWRRLKVDSVALTQWNENLRIWISRTILCRIIREFDSINKSLHNQGLTDITIGSVGLDRLRKTAQGPILQNTPNLPAIVNFLELHANQEYLVNRIRTLAKGGCMSEYKWNGGSSYNGKDWDMTLPTDASIVMHLTATYLDTQLLPLPSKPDIKPFTGYHFFKASEKLPELSDTTLAIHEVSVNPPHYRVIIGQETYELVKGYNNLFHSILLFLYFVNQKECGMLGRVNLGRSGVNMLWIIQSN